MDIFRIIGVALLTTFAVLLIRPTKPEIAALVGLGGGILVVLMFVESLQTIIGNVSHLVDRTGVGGTMFSALLRIVGIAYLAEFAAGICEEAGNTTMAKKVILAGKVVILILALPIINNLIEVVIGIVPN